MPTRDELNGQVLSLLDQIHDLGVDDGKRAQADDDATVIAGLRGQVGDLTTQVAELQAWKDEHQETEPEEPPSPTGPVVGMNFIHGTTLPQETQADAARIYVPDGQTDITTLSEFQRAQSHGIKTFVLSWKNSSPPPWLKTVPKGLTWYGVAHHEPFPEMTPAAFVALQKLHMPAVRAAGGIPTMILQAWDLDPSKPHGDMTPAIPPKGVVDVFGVDYYPAPKSPTQATVVARVKAYMKQAGLDRWLVGEYGVPLSTPGPSAALVSEFKTLAADAEVICYWSQTKSPNDYRFSSQTAAAWFA